MSNWKRLRTELHADSTRSRHQMRLSDIQVAKVEILAIEQPPARIEELLNLPARFPCVHVPEVELILIQDHDPLETNTGLRSRRGWAGTSGHSLTRVRTRLRTFFNLGKSAKKTLHQAHRRVLQHQLESEKKINLVLGENQEDVHFNQGQRSAPQSAQKCVSWRKASLLNSVWKENLEDQNDALHDEELECRRAAP